MMPASVQRGKGRYSPLQIGSEIVAALYSRPDPQRACRNGGLRYVNRLALAEAAARKRARLPGRAQMVLGTVQGAVMNKDNAKDYLPLVLALAEGKTIQAALPSPAGWVDQPEPGFTSPPQHYRIKPEPVKGWYRVALMRDEEGVTYPLVAREGYPQHVVYVRDGFIRWLTDRIEYEV